ncbi:hypothetical protein GS451_25680 [Rhodococcus hoagii]|nr:hypothetical protein [Prescottella equi]
MSPYELAERLVEYARTHFSALDADHIEMMFGVGEFDLTVDGFLVAADQCGCAVDQDILGKIERYTHEPDACELTHPAVARPDRPDPDYLSQLTSGSPSPPLLEKPARKVLNPPPAFLPSQSAARAASFGGTPWGESSTKCVASLAVPKPGTMSCRKRLTFRHTS